jgi:DNA-binding Xre family transcriptional regulator
MYLRIKVRLLSTMKRCRVTFWAANAVAYFARKTHDTAMKNVSFEFDDAEKLRLLGTAIRELRISRGISQEKLSHLCQLDRSHMGRIERGERNVSFLNIVRIARGLACKPSEIMRQANL